MKIQRIMDRVVKKNLRMYLFHLIFLIGAILLVNFFTDPGLQAEKDKLKPITDGKSGVFVSKSKQQPVFTIGSRIFDIKDIPLNKDALISSSYIWQDGIPENLIKEAIDGQKRGLHLLINLTEEDIKSKDFPQMLEKMSQYDLNFRISLIPDQSLSEKDYQKFYDKLWSHLADREIRNISLVWYSNVSFFEKKSDQEEKINWEYLANWDKIDAVGINVSDARDMAKFDRIYQIFADKKEIIINENIIESKPYDIKGGLDFLEEFYYGLALKYPAVTQVFQSSDLNSQVDPKYHQAVKELRKKSWLTNSALETINKPMFEEITAKTVLTDQVDLLYRPLKDDFRDIAYVEYKFNTTTMIQAHRPPFAIKLDLNTLHNGTNLLVTVVYNKQMKIINKQKIYFKVENINVPSRAKRTDKLYSKNQKPSYTGSYIPVLMYHDFASKIPGELSSITVSPGLFEKQLKTLLDHGYTPVSFYQLNQYLNGEAGLPLKPVIITADDGYISNYTIAYPILKKYRVPATFFVTTDFMGVKTNYGHVTWAQAKEMEESGLIDIQSHTHGHHILDNLAKEEVIYETDISFGLIEKNLGKRDVKVFSYPEFRNTINTRKWLDGQGVDLQITGLAKKQGVTSRKNIQRIHVHNKMSPHELINVIKQLTR